MPRAVHTRASVCEPSGNNDCKATGSEVTRLLRSTFMDRCNPQAHPLGFSSKTLPLWLLDLSLGPKDESRGGYCTTPKRLSSYWALDHESMIWAKDLIFTSTKAPAQTHE